MCRMRLPKGNGLARIIYKEATVFEQVASELQDWKCKHGYHDIYARKRWGHVFGQTGYWLTGGICIQCGEPQLHISDGHKSPSPLDRAQKLAKEWLQNELRLWKNRKYQARQNEDKLSFNLIEC